MDKALCQSVAGKISEQTEQKFEILNIKPVSGGDINQSFYISNGISDYFVKTNTANCLPMFEQEAYALKQILNSKTINCPKPIAIGSTNDDAYMVLEYREISSSTTNDWYKLGRQLATLHEKTEHGQFGWPEDNFIGTTLQPNQWQSNWRTFFANQRIGWQLQLLHEKSINFGNIDFIVEACHQILLHHKVSPCLIHGDLWQGNLGFNRGSPIIYDPASYYGDREVDIAMSELFGCLPRSFYQGYFEVFELPPGYEKRKHVYNLYHILNHANLFGDLYIEQAKACISRVIALS